jgi:hypothetical protein
VLGGIDLSCAQSLFPIPWRIEKGDYQNMSLDGA